MTGEKHGIHQLVDGAVKFGNAGITPQMFCNGYICHLCTINKEGRTVDLALTNEQLEQVIEGAKAFYKSKNPIKIEAVWTERNAEDEPDLSWMVTKYDADAQKIIKSHRYSNKDIEKYGWEKVKEWIDEDNERLEAYGQSWWNLFIRAYARIQIPTSPNGDGHRIVQLIRTPGLFGVESDSDDAYFKEVEDDELDTLKHILLAMGIDAVEVSRKIEGAERKEAD